MNLGKSRFFGSSFLIFTLLLGILSLFPSSIIPTYADQNKVDVLIGFEGPPNEALIKSKGGVVSHNFHPFINVLAVSIPESAIQGISKNPNVLYIEEDAIVTAQGHTSTDAEYQNSWGVDHIEADLVATSGNTGTGIKVAVIDTGIDYTHPDLDDNYQVGGPDFVEDDGDPMDDNGHGTHVAGTVAAEKDNFGVVGVGPQISIYGVKVLDSGGSGSYSDLIAAIQWSASNVDIASMSLSGGSSLTSLESAVQQAYADGLLMIAAAGNSGNPGGGGNNIGFPAQYDEVVAVVATNQNDIRASFSSTGLQAELAAPGVNVYSTYLGGYATLSGTSMSTPHVSGSAALVMNSDETCWSSLSAVDGNGSWTNIEVRTVLQSTADDLGDPGRDTRYGFGLVDPDEAAQQCGIPGHTPPTAIDDSAITDEDNAVDIDVLSNDTDVDGDSLDVSSVGTPVNGATTINPDNTIKYTPNADYNGNDSFTYTVKDDKGATSNEATVTVTINAVNDAPVASNDSASTTVDTAVTIDVLSNDTDVDGDSLDVSSVDTSTSSGTATINADNTITYTPASGFAGSDSFEYSITDNNGGVDTATVTVTVSEPSTELTIKEIVPNTGSRGNVVPVTIFGTGFIDDAILGTTTVQMEGGSGPTPDVVVTSVSADGTELYAEVYIKSGGPPRPSTWDVRVTNPDGSSDVLSGGFTVTP